MLVIDPRSNVPPYEQLRSQLVVQITRGELAPGTQLPTVRRLASDLGLAANTVARAYRELEGAGFVRTAGRNGRVVLPPNDGPDVLPARPSQEFTDCRDLPTATPTRSPTPRQSRRLGCQPHCSSPAVFGA